MPYFLQKVKGNKYFVMDITGRQYSKKPLPKSRAERQLKALHIHTGHGLTGGADDGDDAEMAGLNVQEPVEFVPAAAQQIPHRPYGLNPKKRLEKANKFENDTCPVCLGEEQKPLNPERVHIGNCGHWVHKGDCYNSLSGNPEQSIVVDGVVTNIGTKKCPLCNMVGFGLKKRRGGNKWDRVRLIAEDIKKVQKRNNTLASAGTSRPYPYQIGRHFGRVYAPTLEPLPNVQEELFKLVQNGTIDQRDVQYYQSKIDEYLSLNLYQQPLFRVPDPIYKIRQPEVLLGRPGTQETAESALLNLPVGNDHVAHREAIEQAVAQRYVAGLPTRAQVQQSQQQTEEEVQQAKQSLAKQQGTIEQSQDPRELQRGFGRYKFRYSEPDTHILIGDYLEGGGSGKWTALINALSRMYNIPKALVDSTIALNDRKTGAQRFNEKKQNILSQFSDYLNPTIVNEILELDESDPKSVSDYANAIDARRDMALSLRTVQTTNPLQVSVSTSNPLSGRSKFIKKYLKGQGLPATKKNVEKICNIMDVEGIVFE